jgi:hypothetical protein
MLLPYINEDTQLFGRVETESALLGITGEKGESLRCATPGIFGEREAVTVNELTSFLVELLFGELALMRLQSMGFYREGGRRVMDRAEFRITVEYFLSFIVMQAASASLDALFDEIDLDRDGWITYEDYYRFIGLYFQALPTGEAIR